MRSRQVIRPVAALVVLAGITLAGYGVLRATVLAPPTQTMGRLTGVSGAAVVDTATGVLDLDGPRVVVQARAEGGAPVFLGIGRADDVAAYLGTVRRAEITEVSGQGRLTVTRVGSDPGLPDPAGADVWAARARGTGTATLTWPDNPGQWRLVVASDGSHPAPSAIDLTWSRAPRPNRAPVLLVAGSVAVLLGGAGLLVGGRRRPAPAHAEPSEAAPAGAPEAGR